MLKIEGLKNNELILGKGDLFNTSFKVTSKNGAYKRVPFFIDYISNKHISAKIMYSDTIVIQLNPSAISKNEYMVLKNTNGDETKITIIPNVYYTIEKTYDFKITFKRVLKNGALSLKILSKANEFDVGWKCTYNGKPMTYLINPMEGENEDKITINPIGEILSEFDSLIEFTQNESNKKIKLLLTNTPNKGITKAEKKDN